MRQWRRHSPYRAVGIYIGGSDRACDQSNLTAGWVRREAGAGWKFFPMYAGPQAAFGELSNPAAQGTRAAADAVTQAQRLGFGPRTPIYYDMEAYPARATGAALRFLSAWTQALHRLNYLLRRLQQFPVGNYRPVPAIRTRRLCHARCHL